MSVHTDAVPAEYGQDYTNYQLSRGQFRRFVRRFYLRHALSLVRGPAIDLGCGVGDFVRLLPHGSIGLEINPATVAYCQSLGLPVFLYDFESDRAHLKNIEPAHFRTLACIHVLEHLSTPDQTILALAESGIRLGIERMLFIVPGERGFRSDPTHRTFIDRNFLVDHGLDKIDSFAGPAIHYFPVNLSSFGRIFTHNEMVVVYDRQH